MDDTELHRERIIRHAGPVITGRFLGYRPSYTREIEIGRPLVLAVFVTAVLGRLIGRAVRWDTGTRRLKDLKKAPEFLVTPLRLRDDDLDQTYEVEMHGHLPVSALRKGDLVQVTTAAQRDPMLPVKLERMVNLTTLQPLRPRIPSRWSHLGPALLVQAGLGLATLAAVALAWTRIVG